MLRAQKNLWTGRTCSLSINKSTQQEQVNQPSEESTLPEQVNQLPEEYIQPEQVNESSDNPYN